MLCTSKMSVISSGHFKKNSGQDKEEFDKSKRKAASKLSE